MSYLELNIASKHYGEGSDRADVLDNINLSVEEGEFVAIVGFSGSGKTTLISAIAGLIELDSGSITLRGKPVKGPGPDRGVVFQSYSLMPWLSVKQNVSLSVDQVFPGESAKARRKRVSDAVEMVGLGHARDRKPAELSASG